jgi:hypothetical protein
MQTSNLYEIGRRLDENAKRDNGVWLLKKSWNKIILWVLGKRKVRRSLARRSIFYFCGFSAGGGSSFDSSVYAEPQ